MKKLLIFCAALFTLNTQLNGAAGPEATHFIVENNSTKEVIVTAAYSGIFVDQTVPLKSLSAIRIQGKHDGQPLSTIVFNQKTSDEHTRAISTTAKPAGSIRKSQAVIPGSPMLPVSVNPKIAVLNKTLNTLSLEFIYKGSGSMQPKFKEHIAPEGLTNIDLYFAGFTLNTLRITGR